MKILKKNKWNIEENQVTPEVYFYNRRKFLSSTMLTISSAGLSLTGFPSFANSKDYPLSFKNNTKYKTERKITPEEINGKYNNFFEFGSHKEIWKKASKLKLRPWEIIIDGMVEKKISIDIDNLIKSMPLEERVYRHRCVEAWSMVVPWIGFEINHLINLAKPIGNPKFIQFESFLDPSVASGQKQYWYPWPYTESLTFQEAKNELSFIVIGAYGKKLVPQHGGPIRLAVPWKYGFKSIKSIKRITFSDKRSNTFWESLQPKEYGFWANVNPDFPHPRWSQSTERVLGSDKRVPTLIYNGYEEFVSNIYSGMKLSRKLFM
ncbi:MAG: Protein-methionine-sulfoxide reductase catalytic subunit MsrP [Alphaproteobacteria bacterium MarineAlpha2_Bin1]|nr:MAG: Protein-methionine-sulfoxide reductase catalytic subunit MsrP [Alphaproteobacteria bacterium MarineAlpha2_Bin1]